MATHVHLRARRPRIVLAWVTMSFLGAVAAVAQSPPVDEGVLGELGTLPGDARWLAPGADLAATFAARPAEALRTELAGGTPSFLVQLGRLAFRSPSVLGGAAGKLGLACDVCHPNGGVNRDFFVPGLSDRPGNVDLTDTFWHPRSDDGIANPVNIPALRGVRFSAPYGRDGRFAELASVTRRVIVGEFGGPEPTPLILDALVAYQLELDFPPDRDLGPAGELSSGASPAAQRGQTHFRRDCAGCHVPSALFLDRKSHDVGTGGLFDTPTLRGIGDTAPYFHDGRAADLSAVVSHFESALGMEYAAGEAADLVAFLKTVGGGTAPAEAVTLTTEVADIRTFAALLIDPLGAEDAALAERIADMVRDRIGRVHERFHRPEDPAHQQARTTLVAWSRTLQEVAALAEADDFAAARRGLDAWLERSAAATPRLAAASATSLYDPRELADIR